MERARDGHGGCQPALLGVDKREFNELVRGGASTM